MTLEELKANLGQAMRQTRKARDLTLVQVAEQTGLSVSFLSDIETGRTWPSFPTMLKIGQAIAGHFFFGYTEDKKRLYALSDDEWMLILAVRQGQWEAILSHLLSMLKGTASHD